MSSQPMQSLPMTRPVETRTATDTWQRHARVRAMQALCVLDGGDVTLLERLVDFFGDDFEDVVAPSADDVDRARELAVRMTRGAWDARVRYDEMLRARVRNWTPARLGTVERAILRLALHELLGEADEATRPPAKVVINEAIEIARAFGSEDSAAFVNGVLDAAYKEETSKRQNVETSK